MRKMRKMTKEEFVKSRTAIISKMLDNPGESEIYPTTECFAELDDLFDKITGWKKLSWPQQYVQGDENRKKELLTTDFIQEV